MRVPPHSQDAEQALLGAMLLGSEAIGAASEILRGEWTFYSIAHRKIYAAIVHLYGKSQPADITTVAEVLEKAQDLVDCGGRAYLAGLASNVATTANAEYYANIILEKYQLRQTIEIASDVVNVCYRQEMDAKEILDLAETRIFEISDHGARQDFTHLADVIPDVFAAIDKRHEAGGGLIGLSTGLADLDEMVGGLAPGDLILLAGRPSMGKSALAMNIAENAIRDSTKAAAIFSIEMTTERLALRTVCGGARVDSRSADRGRVNDEDWMRLSNAAAELNKIKLFVDSSSTLKPIDIRSKMRRLLSREDVGLIVIDYFQMMQPDKWEDNAQQRFSQTSGRIKAVAKEFDIPVLCLSQLSRAVEARGGDRRPQLSDLRETGALEQDADVVMFIYRPEYYLMHLSHDDPKRIEAQGKAEVIVAKQRNGPTGSVWLNFQKEYVHFDNLKAEQSSEAPTSAGLPF